MYKIISLLIILLYSSSVYSISIKETIKNTVQNNPVVSITNYDHETKIENEKRNIYILKEAYVNIVKDDLDEEMKYKKGGTQYMSPTLKKAENIKLYQ